MPIVLIIFGVILVFVNIKAIKKKDNSFGNVLKYKEENISEVQIEIGQIRKDVAESLTELQSEILQLREIINKDKLHNDSNNKFENNVEYDIDKVLKKTDNKEVINEINTKGKTERIRELLEQGLSEDDICRVLSLGKGEVLLVKGLYKK